MGYRVKKPIVLVGMMGAGKSAVGQALAQRLGVPFLDSDHEIERAAAMSIAEIFARDGETFFRAREAEVISRLLAEGPCVLSVGGGAFLAERTRAAIAEGGISIWLRADVELLWERVRHKQTRPLLRTADPKATLTRLAAERDPIYALADLAVQARPEYSVADMTEQVIGALEVRPDVLEARR